MRRRLGEVVDSASWYVGVGGVELMGAIEGLESGADDEDVWLNLERSIVFGI